MDPFYTPGMRVRSLIDSNNSFSPLAAGDEGEVLSQVTDVLVAVEWKGEKFEGVPYAYMLTHQIEKLETF